MQVDLDADYKLIRNIDASETENWNEKTSDEFTSYSYNGDTTELNFVASEGTINVVDSTGTDVAFTSNTNNDSITIDDTAIDTYQDFTISYDLATPINQGFDPVGTYDSEQANSEFTGSFDGQNHKISNLSINGLNDDYVGLFGAIDAGGEVKNVGVINVNMTGESDYVGGLVGVNFDGTVSNSYSTGNVTGVDEVGGLVGVNFDGTVSNSYSTGNVSGEENYLGGLVGSNRDNGNILNSYSTGNVTGDNAVGGLVGRNDEGNISNSYSTGNVTGVGKVGGLVGHNSNDISNSYSTGNVTSKSGWIGGLIGYNNLGGTVSDSYWDTEATGYDSSAGLPDSNGLTTSQMQGSSAEGNMNFDFTSTWSTVTGDYPELEWQE
jgi:hypothetical protein